MPPHNVPPRTLPRLTSLRALTALLVFAYHLVRWNVISAGVLTVGYAGVAFFFVLSGFVLTWSHRPGTTARTFYLRRFARVYPSHLVMLLATFAVPVVAETRSGTAALANVTLIQAWIPHLAFGMNGVSWSLSCEAFFYLLFPLAIVLMHTSKRAAWIALVYFAAASTFVIIATVDGGLASTVAFTVPAVRLGEFLAGVALAVAVRSGYRLGMRTALIVVASCAAASLIFPHVKPAMDVWATPVFICCIALAAQRDIGERPGFGTRRWLVYLGELSFAFYLVHELTIVNLAHVVHADGVLLAAISLAVAMVAAIALHHLVERPAQRFILRCTNRYKHRPVAARPPKPSRPAEPAIPMIESGTALAASRDTDGPSR